MRKPANTLLPFIYCRCSRTSFVEGLASVLDLGGTLTQNDAETAVAHWSDRLVKQGLLSPDLLRNGRLIAAPGGVRSDVETLQSYWSTVGRYVQEAMDGGRTVISYPSPLSITEAE